MSQNKLLPVIVLGTVVVVGYVGAVTVAQNKVRQVVDKNLALIEERLEAKGQEATLSYKDVSVHGFSLRPTAAVHELHVQIRDANSQNEVILTTPLLHYYPQNFGMTAYRLEIPDEITLATFAPDRPREQSTVSYDSAPAIDVETLPRNDQSFQFYLPKSVVVTTLTETEKPEPVKSESADGGETETLPSIDPLTAKSQRLEILQGDDPFISWKTSEKGEVLESHTLLGKVTVNYQYDPLITADRISFDLVPASGDIAEGQRKIDTLLKLENLNFATIPVLNPVNLTNDISYTLPVGFDENTQLQEGTTFRWEVKDVSLVTGLASFFASGEVTAKPYKERMPYGKLTLRFDELKKLFAHLLETRPAVTDNIAKLRTGIERISGANIEAGDVATIELARDEGGRLQVGKLSLEEAFAVALETMIYVPGILSAKPSETPAATPDAAQGELVTPLPGGGAVSGDASSEEPKQDAPKEENPASADAPVSSTVDPAPAPVATTPSANIPSVPAGAEPATAQQPASPAATTTAPSPAAAPAPEAANAPAETPAPAPVQAPAQ